MPSRIPARDGETDVERETRILVARSGLSERHARAIVVATYWVDAGPDTAELDQLDDVR